MIDWLKAVFRALRNLVTAAVNDPVWAIVCIATAPFRAWKHVLGTFIVVILSGILLGGLSLWLEHLLIPRGSQNPLLQNAFNAACWLILLAIFLRMITHPLLLHFGQGGAEADTHGSARFATEKEVAAFTRSETGLLIGRHGQSRKLLRYDGPAHLLTMAPTRSGKGVGTIIPNLLVQKRSIICIDPKGENARVTARQRGSFGAVHVLDPFGITGLSSACFNPLDMLDPDSPDVSEEAALLADALIYDEPGQSGEAHWNEEAKALITGILLLIAACEPEEKRNLSRLRECLTLAPDAFLDLLAVMAKMPDCNGLIKRAANRHLAKSDREAGGVLSSAQRHTHFLDSPRMAGVLQRSDFAFSDLKTGIATVFLVLPPDRIATYSRWLRLMISQSLTEMTRTPSSGSTSPVLFLLDEFAALGYLPAVERAMGLLAGYGVQLWPILQDIHQLKATYGPRAGTFLSNAGVLQVFGVNDHDSAKMVSELLGQETVVFSTMSHNLDSEQSGISHSQHHTGRALLTPDEVRQLPEHVELLFVARHKPIAAVKLEYFRDKEFAGMYDPV